MKKTLALALLLSAGAVRAQEDGSRARPGLIGFSGILIFYNSSGPLSFESSLPNDLPAGAVAAGEVSAQSCQHGLEVPLSASLQAAKISGAAGDGGFVKAMENLRLARPELKGVYDVKVDVHTISILGVYRRVCTEISARGFR